MIWFSKEMLQANENSKNDDFYLLYLSLLKLNIFLFKNRKSCEKNGKA